MTEEDKKII